MTFAGGAAFWRDDRKAVEHSKPGRPNGPSQLGESGGHTEFVALNAKSRAPILAGRAAANAPARDEASPNILFAAQPSGTLIRSSQRLGKSSEQSSNMPARVRMRLAKSVVGLGSRRRLRLVRENIIGRSVRAIDSATPVIASGCVHGQRGCGRFRSAFALLDEQTRKRCHSALLQPLIENRRHLLAKIGGERQPRKLVTLQRSLGSSEQKLPRWLGLETGQGEPPGEHKDVNSNHNVIPVKNYSSFIEQYPLWKGVEKLRHAGNLARGLIRACSACAGDYEDPERTAETTEPEEENQPARSE